MVSVVFKADVGDTHQAIKTVVRWTGAEERTIKNWFAGTNGPSGAHLVSMFRHSDVVLDACLRLAGRERTIADRKVIETREKLKELLTLFEAMSDNPQ